MRHFTNSFTTVMLMLISMGAAGFVFDNSCSFAEQGKPTAQLGTTQHPTIIDAGNMKSIFADIAEKTIPTVVSVIPTKIDTVNFSNNPFSGFGDSSGGNPFDFFFGPQQKGRGGNPKSQKREFRQQGLGSGVIISSEGYVMTNYHVVAGASEIQVKLNDGRSYDAKVIGSDSLADVAVIKLKEKVSNLPVAYFGDSDKLRAGDWVVAVGNPFSLTSTVTLGIVSAIKRQVESSDRYQDYIQTDAAINPGNSGGALVNVSGELVGINTMIYTQTGGYMGIGFAVPINMARRDAQDIIDKGRVVRGWIGVSIQNIDPATREAMNLGDRKGVLVSDVFKNQPGDKAGLKRGDVISSVNNKPIETGNDLRNLVASINPGTTVPFKVNRNGKDIEVDVKIAERTEQNARAPGQAPQPPPKEKPNQSSETFGIEVNNLTNDIRQQFAISSEVTGVVVTNVNDALNDSRAGLKPGDVIQQVKVKSQDLQQVTSVDQFKKIAKGTKKGDPVMLLVVREGNTFYISFKADVPK